MDYKSRATSGEQAYPMQDGAKSHVSAKYLGTEGDKAQMRRLGRIQETRRVFTFITILGFGSTLICTWEVLLTNIGLILVNGGTAGMFWGFLFVLLGWTVVYLSLSEMASMLVAPSVKIFRRIAMLIDSVITGPQHPADNTTGSASLRQSA
jgi:hypothetical protein